MILNQSTQTTDRFSTPLFDSTDRRCRNCESENFGEDDNRSKLVQLITYLDQQNQQLQSELAKEKQRRNEELSNIIQSLICMESKLQADKKRINQRLSRSDTEICRLICINRFLRKKLGDTKIAKDEFSEHEAFQCLNCRKNVYAINTKDSWSQTNKQSNLSNDIPASDISSDETVPSSFKGVRQCVRYRSRRKFSTLSDYVQSRSVSLDRDFGHEDECTKAMNFKENHKNYETISNYSNTSDKLYVTERVYSIDELNTECDNSSHENRENSSNPQVNFVFKNVNNKTNLSLYHCKNDTINKSNEFFETPLKNKFEISSDNWYASASEGEEEQGVQTNSYGCSIAVNPVLECVNQILLQQSMEETNNDCELRSYDDKSKKNNTALSNTGSNSRKRVHFSTRNSMASVPKDYSDRNEINASIPISFSSQNKGMVKEQNRDNILNYESIYSNEYEPIGSENNSSHLYVDMEAKLVTEEFKNFKNGNAKQPPELPPKPANLLKVSKALKERISNESEKFSNSDDKSVQSEPDYCSISEVNTTPNFVQVVVDVHKEQHFETEPTICLSNDQSEKNKDIDHIFANIPNFSNFSAFTLKNSEPSIVKSIPIKLRNFELPTKSHKSHQQFKRKNVPSIFTEINKRLTYSSLTNTSPRRQNFVQNELLNKPCPNEKVQSSFAKPVVNINPVEQDNVLPLQAEFDWYNLDVEFGKPTSNQSSVNKTSDEVNINDKTKDVLIKLHGIEYNLDEEFSLNGSKDEANANEDESLITIIDAGLPKTSCEIFPTLTEAAPCFKIKKTANFDSFIDSSGLSTKPLPRQGKIYFAGPFV